MRDDFPQKVKELLAKRVGYRCSNPKCRQLTSGPQEDLNKTINVGVACHITAASPDGPRFDALLSSDQRKAALNGIWLCQKCSKLIDNDPIRYNIEKIINWKKNAEEAAIQEIEGDQYTIPELTHDQKSQYIKIEKLMPSLISEMKDDLSKYPLRREFVLLSKKWSYWARGDELIYYFEDHSELKNKIRILENYSLINEITHNNVDRYVITEDFADYLMQ